MATEVREDQRVVQQILRGGIATSVVLMSAGVVAHLITDPGAEARAVQFTQLVNPATSVPDLLLGWGILVLALTPVVRVVSLILLWARMKDWVYFGVSLTVLFVLGFAVAVGHG